MNNEQIKIVPTLKKEEPIIKKQKKITHTIAKKDSFVVTLAQIFCCYVLLLLVVSFVPLPLSIKIISLMLGSFIIIDCLHSFKAYVREKFRTNR